MVDSAGHFFGGGLALNLTPCVYSLIPITVSYFGGRGQKGRARILVHGMLYIFGLALTNSMLGLRASLSGGLLGSALQHPVVLLFVAGIMATLSLSFFGFWEFRVPEGITRVASKSYGGYFGPFFMGLTLGIVAAPCLARPLHAARLACLGHETCRRVARAERGLRVEDS